MIVIMLPLRYQLISLQNIEWHNQIKTGEKQSYQTKWIPIHI